MITHEKALSNTHIDYIRYFNYHKLMDNNQDFSKDKPSSVLSIISIEGGVILVLVLAILATFNYFNIVPLSKFLPFLPHQRENQKMANQLTQNKSDFKAGDKCQNLPKNITVDIKQPSATIPASLAAYSGIWQGKWGGKIPSTLIVNEITPFSVYTIYIFNGVSQEYSFKVNSEGFISPPLFWRMSKDDTLIGVYKRDASSSASFIEMKRCKPE